MTDSAMAAILARTYLHRVSAWRNTGEREEEPVYEAAPCGLSRRAINTAPSPSAMDAVLPESAYRLTLYTRPEQPFQLHDRVEVTDERGRVYHGRTSDSFCYPTHCVAVMEVYEVTEANKGSPAEPSVAVLLGERTSIEVSELSAAQEGPPTETSVSVSVGERRSSETSELSAVAESEGYGACSDESEGYGDCADESHVSLVQSAGEVTV